MKYILIRGAGEMASGTACRLMAVGFRPIMTELSRPLAVRRGVSFAQAVFAGQVEVEGIGAKRVGSVDEALSCSRQGQVPVLVGESEDAVLSMLQPFGLVDARLAKKNLGTRIDEAPVVIGLGPGFAAGVDVHAVIETNRGHDLGRVLYTGAALPDTGNPGEISGYSCQRVIKVPVAGVFSSERKIGDAITTGDQFGAVDGTPIPAPLSGVVRGLLMSGTWVAARTKLGDIDPRGVVEYCFTISEKARAIAGGVLEALLALAGGVD